MDGLSLYQLARKRNVEENSQFLIKHNLHLQNSDCKKSPTVIKRVKKRQSLERKHDHNEKRFSLRIRLKVNDGASEEDYSKYDEDDENDQLLYNRDQLLANLSQPNYKIARVPRPKSYGSIKGVKVGTWWQTRLDCNYDGIHRPTVAGIHPGPDGAYSVALSGGYEDDVDLGDSFTYTGEGGRDLKGTASNPKNLRTAPQSKDQNLQRGNLALSRNVETGKPVRVIRGYKLNSKFAPQQGYRYDGLYEVTRYWEAVGKAGYRIYKFEFKRCDPEPAPWSLPSSPTPPEIPNNSFDGEDGSSPSPQELCYHTPDNDNGSKKIKYSELSPGKKSPIEVSDSVESLKDSSVAMSHIDRGWPGWEKVCVVPGSDCLSLECEGRVVRVCVTGNEWQSVVSDLTKSCASPVLSTLSQDIVDSQNICNHKENVCDCHKDSDTMLQSQVNSYRSNMEILGVEYEGYIVHVYWRDNKFQEITPSVGCDEDFATDCNWPGWPSVLSA